MSRNWKVLCCFSQLFAMETVHTFFKTDSKPSFAKLANQFPLLFQKFATTLNIISGESCKVLATKSNLSKKRKDFSGCSKNHFFGILL